MIDVEIKENKVESKVYHALIFIESLRNVKEQERGIEYFFSYEVNKINFFFDITNLII